MVWFLTTIEIMLVKILYATQKFRTGWKITIYRRIYRDGSSKFCTVKWRLQRFLRGIRYVRGKEGVPIQKCGNCGHLETDHEICCPGSIASLTAEEIMALLEIPEEDQGEQPIGQEDVSSNHDKV